MTNSRYKRHNRENSLKRSYARQSVARPERRAFLFVSSDIVLGKICTNCTVIKPSGDFFRRSANRSGLSSWCKACQGPATQRAASKRSPEERRKQERAYWAKNKEKKREKDKRRYARRKGARKSDFKESEWQEILIEYNFKCFFCGRQNRDLAGDHFRPLSRGGDHTRSNIVPACQPCNSSKNNKMIDEYVFYLSNQYGTRTSPNIRRDDLDFWYEVAEMLHEPDEDGSI